MVDTGCIHVAQETVGGVLVGCDDAFAMTGPIGADVCQRLVQTTDHTDAEIVREPFAAEVAVVELYLSLHGGEEFGQTWLEVAMHQQTIQCVAHTDTAALGIVYDALCHLHVGILVHIAVYHSGTGLDDGNL